MIYSEELEISFLGYLLRERPPISLLGSLRKEFSLNVPQVRETVDHVIKSINCDLPFPDKDAVSSLLPKHKALYNTAYKADRLAGDLNSYAVLFHKAKTDENMKSLAESLRRALDSDDMDRAATIGDELARLRRSGRSVVVPVDVDEFVDIDSMLQPEEFLTTHIPRLNQHLSGWPNESNYEKTGGFSLGELAIIGGSTNMGKGIPINEVVPTPDGMVRADKIKKGDHLFGRDGKPVRVFAISNVHTRRFCYEVIFNDGARIKTDDRHKWLVYPYEEHDGEITDRSPGLKTTRQLYRLIEKSPEKNLRFKIPLAEAVEYTEKELPIHPYALGFWLVNTEDIFKEEHDYLRKEKLYTRRRIPVIYKMGSIAQRQELIKGMMDARGIPGKDYNSISIRSKQLGRDFTEVICSLGGKATKKVMSHYIDVRTPFNPFKLKDKFIYASYGIDDPYRHIISINPIDTVKTICFSVVGKERLYLASRYHVVTHNSAVARSFWHNFIEKSVESDKYKSVYINYEGAYTRFRKEFFAMITGVYPSMSDPAIYASAMNEYKKFLENRKDKFVVYDGAAGEMPNTTSSLENEIYKRAEEGFRIFFIDTINSVDDTSGKESWHITELAMRMLERAAKRYDLCIIATAQNKQGLQFEESQWPELKWIGQSAYLQQKAGVAIGIYRADLFSNGAADYTSLAIMKSRVRSVMPKEGVNVSYDVKRRMYVPYQGSSLSIIEAPEMVQEEQLMTALSHNIETAYAAI